MTDPFKSTITLISTLRNLTTKQSPTKINAYMISGTGVLPFYVSFNLKILKKRFLLIIDKLTC